MRPACASVVADDFRMNACIIDGAAIATAIRHQVAERASHLKANGCPPGLAVVLVGSVPASQIYVKHKVADCAAAGVRSVLETYPEMLTESELLARIAALNADPSIHGILVQMPLPRHIDPQRVIAEISVDKDVDGFSTLSAGELMTGLPGFRPCTPAGCMRLIAATGVNLRGQHAVVIGRSNTVGKPMAQLLLQADATVSICHSATRDLAAITRQADVVVAAVGRSNVLTASMVKPGAVVIDVGMNRNADGKLCGDVDFAGVSQVAGWITPVPGGVGPMTRAMLLVNTVDAAERLAGFGSP